MSPSGPIARGRRQPRDFSQFNANPAWQPRRRAMALKGATYMQSALEGSWLMPNNSLKSHKLFSRRFLNSLPCGEGLGVAIGGHTARNNDDPLPSPHELIPFHRGVLQGTRSVAMRRAVRVALLRLRLCGPGCRAGSVRQARIAHGDLLEVAHPLGDLLL
jgi:hypothetical protein